MNEEADNTTTVAPVAGSLVSVGASWLPAPAGKGAQRRGEVFFSQREQYLATNRSSIVLQTGAVFCKTQDQQPAAERAA